MSLMNSFWALVAANPDMIPTKEEQNSSDEHSEPKEGEEICMSEEEPKEDEESYMSEEEPKEDEDICMSEEEPKEDEDFMIYDSAEPKADEDFMIYDSAEPKADEDFMIYDSAEPKADEDIIIDDSEEPKEDEDIIIDDSEEPKEDEDIIIDDSEEPKEDEDIVLLEDDALPSTVRLLKGQSGEEAIHELIEAMHRYVSKYWINYYKGIDTFAGRMILASSEEANPQYLSVAFWSVCKTTLDLALDAAGEKYGGPWKVMIKYAKGIGEDWYAECKRAGKAEGEADLASYITKIKNGIDSSQESMENVVKDAEASLLEEMRRLSAEVEGIVQDSDGWVTGKPAELIKGVQAGVDAFNAAIPTSAAFQQQFTTAYAASAKSSTGGGIEGKLRFEVSLLKSLYVSGLRLEFNNNETSTAWTLVTPQADPDRIAQSLLDSQNGELDVLKIKLPKTVEIKVCDGTDLFRTYNGSLTFDSNESYTIQTVEGKHDSIDDAWKFARTRVMSNTKELKGSNT